MSSGPLRAPRRVPRCRRATRSRRPTGRLARQYHPDVNPDPATQEKFKEVTRAYEVLSDPQKRAMYDLGGDPFGGAGGGLRPGRRLLLHRHHGRLLRRRAAGAGTPGRGPRPRVRRGQDALIRLEIELAEAAFGITRELKVDTAVVLHDLPRRRRRPGFAARSPARPAAAAARSSTCSARSSARSAPCVRARPAAASARSSPSRAASAPATAGSRSRRSLTVKIPAGVDTGTRVQLTGQGEVGPGGGPAGDLYVEIHVAQHPIFPRDGLDLHCSVSIPMTAAALGTTIELPTARGRPGPRDRARRGVTIRPRGPARHPVRHRAGARAARGVPRLRGTGRGDLVVRIVVETPTRLDARQEELLRELAALRDEEAPDGHLTPAHKSVFDRLRDAFNPPMTLPGASSPTLAGGGRRRPGRGRRRRGASRRRREAASASASRSSLTDGAGTSATVHGHRDRQGGC